MITRDGTAGRRNDGQTKCEGRKVGRKNARRVRLVLLSSLLVFPSCGKKAPPLAPLSMSPEAPRMVTARRLGDTVYLQMTVPEKAAVGNGGFSVDHIDVYAVTLAPGTPTPPNRDLLKPQYVVAKIPVQPLPDPEAAEPAEPDTRPLPGEVVTFVEKLTEAQLVPQVVTKPVPPGKAAKPPATPAPVAAAATAPPPPPQGPQVLTRLYALQGVPKSGKPGPASLRVEVPLLVAPGPPRRGTPTSSETSVTIAWEPPASTTDEAPGVLYNVYAVTPASAATPAGAAVRVSAPKPLNDKPIADQTFVHDGADSGKEQCFVVRSVAAVGTAMLESEPSEPICITPADTYPPATPKGLAAVASPGVINLIWDPNAETDLAGYFILRGEAPGATLTRLVPEPIRETRFADRTARPNTRYVYAIVAVDKAGNRSTPSNRVEEAAR